MSVSSYPQWVTEQRPKGHVIKKVGNKFYLYKRTSKRIPGKKYPQAEDTYVGMITENGISYSSTKKVTLSNAEVYEFGFSRTLESIVTDEWKKTLKNDWHDVLLAIINLYSPNSYLFRDTAVPTPNRNIDLHAGKLERLIEPLTFEDLEPLKTVYLIHFEEQDVISRIKPLQKELADRLSVKLEVD